KIVDLLAGDELKVSDAVSFINDGVSAVNVGVGATFPLLEDAKDELVLPEEWQRMLIVPYAKGRIKEMQSEHPSTWEVAYNTFYDNLAIFKDTYVIPDEYKQHEYSSIAEQIISLADSRMRPEDI